MKQAEKIFLEKKRLWKKKELGGKKRHEMLKQGRVVAMQNKEKLLTYLTVLEMNNTTYHRVVTDPWGISNKN